MNMRTVTKGREPRNPRAHDAASNVIPFPTVAADPFSALTARMVVERFRRGELPEAILLALLASAGLRP
jgi:hypothetical protein